MDKKKLMLLLGALIVAIGTALAARSLLSGSPAPTVQAMAPAVPQGPKVLVAQRALPVGTIITIDAINFQPWPKEMVRDAYFVDGAVNMNKLVGTVVRFPITAGQPLTQGSLVAPGDRGFLAAALGPGMRAITITVSEKSGVAGFVFPGDHVDLMLTQKVTSYMGLDQRPLNATETILRNLRVLATDQTTETESANGKSVVRTAHTVTLETTPRIAEKIEVSQTVGSISLVLRSLADNQTELDKAIASGSIKLPESASKKDEENALSLASHKPVDGTTTFVTGGDVSRFQRKTMPASGPSAVSSAINAVASRLGIPKKGLFAKPDDFVRVTRGRDSQSVSPSGMASIPGLNLPGGNSGQAPNNPFEGH